MCGIIGSYRVKGQDPLKIAALRDLLSHRGPDDKGLWAAENNTLVLGHRRLSIIDLTTHGHQPMESSCGRYVITYNGEIYNYIELRHQLQGYGFEFRSSSDTEVILSAYSKWGEHCLDKLNGMFAFAIWDNGTGNVPPSLFIARDRAGEKPFYYSHQSGSFSFASELKSLPSLNGNKINFQALNHYLALGYIPGNLCLLDNVNKLPAGHAARFFPDQDELKVWAWWQLPDLGDTLQCDAEQLADKAHELLISSVKLRLRSDVPVGVLLSGGMDSSLVVACAAEASEKRIKTFTMALPGSEMDESHHAKVVAQYFDTEHHVLEIATPSMDVLNEFGALVDEPIADSSIIPSYLISKLTAGHVKVALGGDGGDELFGGYRDYTRALMDSALMDWIPDSLFKSFGVAGFMPTGFRGRNRLSSLRGGPAQSIIWGSPYFDVQARKRILHPDIRKELGDAFLAPEYSLLELFNTGSNPVDSMTRTHFGSILPDDFLVKVDRTSMASGLEMRTPFLDKDLMEFAFSSIPSHMKVSKDQSRILEREIASRLLPQNLDTDRKQGFSVPVDKWLRQGSEELVHKTIPMISPWINTKEYNSLYRTHLCGRANGSRLFSLQMLGIAVKNLQIH